MQNFLVFWLSYKTYNLADIFFISIKMVTNFWLRSSTKEINQHSNQSGIETEQWLKILWSSLWGIVPKTFNHGIMTISFTLDWNEAGGAQKVVRKKGVNCENLVLFSVKMVLPQRKIWIITTPVNSLQIQHWGVLKIHVQYIGDTKYLCEDKSGCYLEMPKVVRAPMKALQQWGYSQYLHSLRCSLSSAGLRMIP